MERVDHLSGPAGFTGLAPSAPPASRAGREGTVLFNCASGPGGLFVFEDNAPLVLVQVLVTLGASGTILVELVDVTYDSLTRIITVDPGSELLIGSVSAAGLVLSSRIVLSVGQALRVTTDTPGRASLCYKQERATAY